MKTQYGFTLVEAMVVVTIAAILAAFVIPTFQGSMTRSTVRKTIDLISQTIAMSQSEALRRNIKTYMTVVATNLCIGSTPGGCDLRQQSLISGVAITGPMLTLSPFYGAPSPAPTLFTVTYSGMTQTVNIDRLGIVTVGPAS